MLPRPFPPFHAPRSPDPGIGWRYLSSRQARALSRASLGLESPSPELLPFPAAAKPPLRAGGIARRILGALAGAILGALFCYVAATSLLIAAYRFADPPATVLMVYRKFGYGWELAPPRPLPLRRIPSYIRSMLIGAEDGKFYDHFGLDFEAFARARRVNAVLGKPVYGGSTLTMQVARTLFLVPEKSYLRKGLEVIAALELELLLPKERILELYFGYAEWGKGIFGIEAAARRYYGTGVAAISRDQAARLVALLSSPIVYRPGTLQRSAILRERYAYLSRRFVLPREDRESAGAEEAPPGEAAGLVGDASPEVPAGPEPAAPTEIPDGAAPDGAAQDGAGAEVPGDAPPPADEAAPAPEAASSGTGAPGAAGEVRQPAPAQAPPPAPAQAPAQAPTAAAQTSAAQPSTSPAGRASGRSDSVFRSLIDSTKSGESGP